MLNAFSISSFTPFGSNKLISEASDLPGFDVRVGLPGQVSHIVIKDGSNNMGIRMHIHHIGRDNDGDVTFWAFKHEHNKNLIAIIYND